MRSEDANNAEERRRSPERPQPKRGQAPQQPRRAQGRQAGAAARPNAKQLAGQQPRKKQAQPRKGSAAAGASRGRSAQEQAEARKQRRQSPQAGASQARGAQAAPRSDAPRGDNRQQAARQQAARTQGSRPSARSQGRPVARPAERPTQSRASKQAQEKALGKKGDYASKQAGAPAPEDTRGGKPALFVSQDTSPGARFAERISAAVRTMAPTTKRTLGIIAAVLLVYFIVAIYFSLHFYPRSHIGTIEVGGMDAGAAAEAIGSAAGGYELQVEGEEGFSFTVMNHEAGLSLDTMSMAEQALSENSGLFWPVMMLLPHDYSDVLVASADASGFRAKVADAVQWFNEKAEPPEDATIVYDSGERTFKIQQEKLGNMLDGNKVVEHVVQALATMEPVLKLGDDDYQRPSVYADDERLAQALEQAQKVLDTNLSFTTHGKEVAKLTGEEAATWVISTDAAELALNEDKVNVFVQDVYDKSTTIGTSRTWKREDGKTFTVEGGTYGWQADWLAIDEQLHVLIWEGRSASIDVPMLDEAAAYDGEHGRDWKAYIDVDLDAQHATYYDDDGKILWESDFVSGTPDGKHDTPKGVYTILNMESPSTLVGERNASGSPEYQTKVQYWMAWRGNDIGFHDADWQYSFGGTLYQQGAGSHGCINLSVNAAAALYKLVDIGTVVVAHGTDTTRVEDTLSSTTSDTDGGSSSEQSQQQSDQESYSQDDAYSESYGESYDDSYDEGYAG